MLLTPSPHGAEAARTRQSLLLPSAPAKAAPAHGSAGFLPQSRPHFWAGGRGSVPPRGAGDSALVAACCCRAGHKPCCRSLPWCRQHLDLQGAAGHGDVMLGDVPSTVCHSAKCLCWEQRWPWQASHRLQRWLLVNLFRPLTRL